MYTSALRLLALRELLFTLYLYSGLRPSVRGKVTSDNRNLRNLGYNEKKLSRDVGVNKIGNLFQYIQLP